ncbi:uncharacterized protein PSFLO_00889 [Pseudozyma flocculosa]|uniref:Uncharacterized protein n=1 Tax=Pseudozyma flocculosa TaxID=84751 RepID=A0A5C3ET24_9BASI|nr:uncharacterized protein PSFLO_00889 [Pseudozyma flocculosa]
MLADKGGVDFAFQLLVRRQEPVPPFAPATTTLHRHSTCSSRDYSRCSEMGPSGSSRAVGAWGSAGCADPLTLGPLRHSQARQKYRGGHAALGSSLLVVLGASRARSALDATKDSPSKADAVVYRWASVEGGWSQCGTTGDRYDRDGLARSKARARRPE